MRKATPHKTKNIHKVDLLCTPMSAQRSLASHRRRDEQSNEERRTREDKEKKEAKDEGGEEKTEKAMEHLRQPSAKFAQRGLGKTV